MSEMKNCERCGKPFKSYFYETMCPRCSTEKYDEDLRERLVSGEETETDCESDVYCPWCGEKIETDCESREFYEEDTFAYTCPFCDKEFALSTSVSYHYSTKRELPSYIIEGREQQKRDREKHMKAMRDGI